MGRRRRRRNVVSAKGLGVGSQVELGQSHLNITWMNYGKAPGWVQDGGLIIFFYQKCCGWFLPICQGAEIHAQNVKPILDFHPSVPTPGTPRDVGKRKLYLPGQPPSNRLDVPSPIPASVSHTWGGQASPGPGPLPLPEPKAQEVIRGALVSQEWLAFQAHTTRKLQFSLTHRYAS